jgi:pimeloyl-ACP methyl ester carboxylesterase
VTHARGLATALLVVALSSCGLVDGEGTPELPSKPLGSASSPVAGSGGSAARAASARALQPFYTQELAWKDCRDGDECAELEVPLDYDEPEGETITLSVLRVPATEPSKRVGSLVVNPGGPGVSGVNYAAAATSAFGLEIRAAFDVVGFDPRGVAASTPLDCVDDSMVDELVAADPDPDTPAEVATADVLLRELGRGCLARAGDLTRHMSTQEAARDIDILRAALGQDTLAYFGASYGTFLGATYADLFPGRVGRMVLDGAVDPSVGLVEMSLVQAEGFEVALRAYVEDCPARDDCPLGDDPDTALATIQELLAQVDRQPLPGDGSRDLTEGLAVLGIWEPLYVRDFWPSLDTALAAALDGDGEVLLQIADAYLHRTEKGYSDNSTEAIYAINCLDRDEAVPGDQVERYLPRFEEVSPTFGRVFAYGLTACGSWPVHSGTKPAPLEAKGAAPILVVGTTRDPATPLAWARSLADQLDSGILVTRDGDGHTGYRAGNACVDRTVERYLVSGTVPQSDVSC